MSKIAKKKKLAAQRRRKKQQDSLSVPVHFLFQIQNRKLSNNSWFSSLILVFLHLIGMKIILNFFFLTDQEIQEGRQEEEGSEEAPQQEGPRSTQWFKKKNPRMRRIGSIYF